MKKYLLLIAVWLAALTVSADVIDTGNIESYPAKQNVYVPSYYGTELYVYYNAAIVSDSPVTATIHYGVNSTATMTAYPNVGDWNLSFPLAETLEDAGVSGAFTVSVPSVSLGNVDMVFNDTITWIPTLVPRDTVPSETYSASYLLRSVMPTCTITPSSGTVNSKDLMVTFSFSEIVTCPAVKVTSNSSDFDTESKSEIYDIDEEECTDSVVEFTIYTEDWADGEEPLYLNVETYNLNINGYYLPYQSVQYQYGTPSTTFQYLGANPNNVPYPWVEDWSVAFRFSDSVNTTSTNAAVITFKDINGSVLATEYVLANNVTCEYAGEIGCYVALVPTPNIPTTASNYETVTVQLIGIAHDGVVLQSQPSATFYKPTEQPENRAPQKQGTTGISEIQSNDKQYSVYSLNGNVICNVKTIVDIKSLGQGVFIINGKKYINK